MGASGSTLGQSATKLVHWVYSQGNFKRTHASFSGYRLSAAMHAAVQTPAAPSIFWSSRKSIVCFIIQANWLFCLWLILSVGRVFVVCRWVLCGICQGLFSSGGWSSDACGFSLALKAGAL
jgi:hypothetical protein